MDEDFLQRRDLYEGVLRAQSVLGEGLVVIEDEHVRHANDAFCEMSGYALEELRALPSFMDLVAQEERASIFERRCPGGDEAETHYETTLRHKDGRPVAIEVAVKMLEGRGRFGSVAIVRDLTGLKRAEAIKEELARRVELWAEVSEALAGDGALPEVLQHCVEAMVRHLAVALARVWTLDAAGGAPRLRASAGPHTGPDGPLSRVPVGERMGLVVRDRRPYVTNDISGDPNFQEKEWARQEGLVACVAYPLIVEDDVVGVLALFARGPFSEDRLAGMASVSDVVAKGIRRKRVERDFRDTEARYRMLVENIPAVTYVQEIADPDSSKASPTMYASPQIEAQSGYPPRAFEENPELWIKLLYPEDRERVLAEDERTDETGEPFNVEYRQFAGDGRVLWIRVQATLVRDEVGRPRFWQGIQLDITELKQAEETLQEANRHLEELAALRADFTAMVAHEIGSPLAAIRGFLDMLGTGELEPAEQAEAVAKIQTEVGRLSTLVADARSAAAVEQGEFALMLRRTPVEELLADAVRFAEMDFGDHPVEVGVVADGQVLADPYRIGQVLRNLLSNAAKYSPDGAPIELRSLPGETPGRLRVEVSDHGRGVHPDDVDRIFEKFGRGRDLSGRQAYGVGLGRYLTRRIVRAHGSDLTLRSVPGGGSAFSFELEAVP